MNCLILKYNVVPPVTMSLTNAQNSADDLFEQCLVVDVWIEERMVRSNGKGELECHRQCWQLTISVKITQHETFV